MSSFVPSLVGAIVGYGIAMGLLLLLMRLRVLPFDRRARLDQGRLDLPLWKGTCAAARPVAVDVDVAHAGRLVATALDRVGAKDVLVLDAWTMAGWRGFSWRTTGEQIGITIQPNGPDRVVLWCCCRSRLATAIIDLGATARSAARLATVVEDAARSERLTYSSSGPTAAPAAGS